MPTMPTVTAAEQVAAAISDPTFTDPDGLALNALRRWYAGQLLAVTRTEVQQRLRDTTDDPTITLTDAQWDAVWWAVDDTIDQTI